LAGGKTRLSMISSRTLFSSLLLSATLGCVLSVRSAAPPDPPDAMITVSFLDGYDPDTPEGPITRQILRLVREEPRLNPQKWGGLTLPGAGGRAPFMLSLAGGSAPDLYYCWFHIIRHDIDQGFIHPLNEWIGDDLNGDGRIDDSEARWEGWKDVPELWRQVAVKEGKIYGVPLAGTWYYGIVYRKDLVRQAGIDPDYIPQSWEEFFHWCQRLTFPDAMSPAPVCSAVSARSASKPPLGLAAVDAVRRRVAGCQSAPITSDRQNLPLRHGGNRPPRTRHRRGSFDRSRACGRRISIRPRRWPPPLFCTVWSGRPGYGVPTVRRSI
jgi:hypothetical protein